MTDAGQEPRETFRHKPPTTYAEPATGGTCGGLFLHDAADRGADRKREPIMRLFQQMVQVELCEAEAKFPPLNSAHEAYAVIREELDEFWEMTKQKQSIRDENAMLAELVQIAAMAQRAAQDLGLVGQ